MRRIVLLLVMFTCTGILAFSQSQGNRRFVSVQTTILKESTGFFSRALGSLSFGDEVTMTGENGKWAQIEAGNLKGWVFASSLSSRRIIASGTAGAATELSLAGKGFTQEMEVEYRKSGLDYSMVDSMEKTNVPTEDLLGFITEGRLAMGEN